MDLSTKSAPEFATAYSQFHGLRSPDGLCSVSPLQLHIKRTTRTKATLPQAVSTGGWCTTSRVNLCSVLYIKSLGRMSDDAEFGTKMLNDLPGIDIYVERVTGSSSGIVKQ